MIALVLDASVAAKWAIPSAKESLTLESLQLLKRYTAGEVNFIVPAVPAGTPLCAAPIEVAGRNIVESNLAVSVGGGYSFDAARICVDVHSPNP